ncbi:hypothetical protein SAMN04487977_101519 [Treponema bryantii]|uniref:Uncharacterized protein n=1 Tax=Treponema bryantii TaxID=163 RepID=A0A1H9AZD9_9SPIR|nr:hypothetical protein [Treponema bryantii]SEP81895.1 hypothetical protein SAMN04487977_101519 [Treponema bryantii]
MAEKVMIVLTFLLITFFVGTFICVKNRLDEIENRLALERAEIEEMQKKQRLTAQDVKFIEYLVLEGEQK